MAHTSHPSKEEVRGKYDEFARYYDLAEAVPEFFGIRSLRRQLAERARGRTLEVAVGSGKNLRLFPRDIELTAGDMSQGMLEFAQRKARKAGMNVNFSILDAEHLPFLDDSFDTVFSTLSSCTFPDPVAAFREMSRVCKPEGKILLLEHGRSSARPIGWYQDRRADTHARQLGCRWNRHPVQLAREAGLELDEARTHFFDIFALIEARPAKSP